MTEELLGELHDRISDDSALGGWDGEEEGKGRGVVLIRLREVVEKVVDVLRNSSWLMVSDVVVGQSFWVFASAPELSFLFMFRRRVVR